MYDRIAIDMVEELAKQTIFSKSALEKQDAQKTAPRHFRLVASWLRKFQRKATTLPNGCESAMQSGMRHLESD